MEEYYSGGRACAGIGLPPLKVSITAAMVTGTPLTESGEPAGEAFALVFPDGFRIELEDDAPIVHSPDDGVTVRDGDVILEAGACLEPAAYFLGFDGKPWEIVRAGER
jgi:hypothetical protein